VILPFILLLSFGMVSLDIFAMIVSLMVRWIEEIWIIDSYAVC